MRNNQTREKVIQEAAKEFYLQGYTATTMRSLASAVGIKHPSLFSLFDNKSAIAAVILSKYYAGVEKTAEEYLKEHPDEITGEDAKLLVFHAVNLILMYEDRHISEFFSSFYEEDAESVDDVIRTIYDLDGDPDWDERTKTEYRLDMKLLGMTSAMLARELEERTIRPEFATQYFIRRIIYTRHSDWNITKESANRFYTDHWEAIKDTAWKIDVYRDYFSD